MNLAAGSPPHVREKSCQTGAASLALGSPPHVRGKVPYPQRGPDVTRITPACAGKSLWRWQHRQSDWDHPRMCGEKAVFDMCSCHSLGSPPHVRGKVACKVQAVCYEGITPACAGKRGCPHSGPGTTRDHPRVCGEKFVRNACSVIVWGSPPRMRGKGICFRLEKRPRGITPACAGKSKCRLVSCGHIWDHPRMCGEKLFAFLVFCPNIGSPPHVRGKEGKEYLQETESRITPACAGKRQGH